MALLATVQLHLSVHLFRDMHSFRPQTHLLHTFLLAQQLQPQCLCCFCSVSAFEAESKVAYAKLEDFLTEAAILQVCMSLLCQPSLEDQRFHLMLVFITITSLQDILSIGNPIHAPQH